MLDREDLTRNLELSAPNPAWSAQSTLHLQCFEQFTIECSHVPRREGNSRRSRGRRCRHIRNVSVHAIQPQAGSIAVYVAIKYVDRKSTRLNSSHSQISYAVFCLKKK